VFAWPPTGHVTRPSRFRRSTSFASWVVDVSPWSMILCAWFLPTSSTARQRMSTSCLAFSSRRSGCNVAIAGSEPPPRDLSCCTHRCRDCQPNPPSPAFLPSTQAVSQFQEAQTFPEGALTYPPDRPILQGRHLDVGHTVVELRRIERE